MSKILILIGGHLCNAPRPQKEAEALSSAGHDVTVGGIWFDQELIERDRLLINNRKWKFIPIVNFQPSHRLTNFLVRCQSRIAQEIFRKFGIFSPPLLGYGSRAMLKYAYQNEADLTIVHSEVGLWVGSRLLDCGLKVGVDFEDWFSEDLLPQSQLTRPIKKLKELEKRLINECKYSITTSYALANAMAEAYDATRPVAIYNSFPWSERSQIDGQTRDRQNLDLTSIHWFSQTIGQGRGLEFLFQSLPYFNKSMEIHLRGNYPENSRQWLEQQISPEWRDRIFIHSTVPNNELLSRIAEHDIGLALEVNDIPSRNLTITNKFFQYLQAGLAIIATSTAGQNEILSQYPEVGRIIPSNDAIALAEAVNSLINNPSKLSSNQQFALKAAREKLNWEKQEDKIVALVEQAISSY